MTDAPAAKPVAKQTKTAADADLGGKAKFEVKKVRFNIFTAS